MDKSCIAGSVVIADKVVITYKSSIDDKLAINEKNIPFRVVKYQNNIKVQRITYKVSEILVTKNAGTLIITYLNDKEQFSEQIPNQFSEQFLDYLSFNMLDNSSEFTETIAYVDSECNIVCDVPISYIDQFNMILVMDDKNKNKLIEIRNKYKIQLIEKYKLAESCLSDAIIYMFELYDLITRKELFGLNYMDKEIDNILYNFEKNKPALKNLQIDAACDIMLTCDDILSIMSGNINIIYNKLIGITCVSNNLPGLNNLHRFNSIYEFMYESDKFKPSCVLLHIMHFHINQDLFIELFCNIYKMENSISSYRIILSNFIQDIFSLDSDNLFQQLELLEYILREYPPYKMDELAVFVVKQVYNNSKINDVGLHGYPSVYDNFTLLFYLINKNIDQIIKILKNIGRNNKIDANCYCIIWNKETGDFNPTVQIPNILCNLYFKSLKMPNNNIELDCSVLINKFPKIKKYPNLTDAEILFYTFQIYDENKFKILFNTIKCKNCIIYSKNFITPLFNYLKLEIKIPEIIIDNELPIDNNLLQTIYKKLPNRDRVIEITKQININENIEVVHLN